jgi:hypothetical protein
MTSIKGFGQFEPGDLEINGKKLHGDLLRIVTDFEPRRKISGASTVTLTLDDPEGWFLQSGLYSSNPGHRTDLQLDNLWFRSCGLSKSGSIYKWQLESRPIALLRLHTKARRVSRAHSTLAQFLKSLVAEEPSVGFISPEIGKKRPIAKRTEAETKAVRDASRARGLAQGSDIRIKGRRPTKEQVDVLNQSLAAAESHSATTGRAGLALIVAEIDESECTNPSVATDHDSLGALQARAGIWGRSNALDIEWCVNKFLTEGFTGRGGAIHLAAEHPDWSPADIASAVQGNAAGSSVYTPYEKEAQKILDEYGGLTSGPSADGGSATYVKQFIYGRGAPVGPKGEDTWACGNRYAELLGWRWFENDNNVYWISDFDLIRSRPRTLPLDEDSPGINSIDFDLDTSHKKPDLVTISCRAGAWGAPPGTVVPLGQALGEDVAGAWIVAEAFKASGGLLDATVILTRPNSPKPELASAIVQRPNGQVGEDQGGLDPKTHVMKALAKAQWIASQRFPYVFGGGHRSDGTFGPSNAAGGYQPGPVGYDCSSMVCDILHSAGVFPGPGVTDVAGLLNWGQPGKGKYMTVWIKGPDEHTFIEFDLPTGKTFFEAHHTGTIVGEERTRSTEGFQPRHWAGT